MRSVRLSAAASTQRSNRSRQLAFEPLEGRAMLSLTHWYTFNDGTADDLVGGVQATLHNGAQILDGQLALRNLGVSSGQSSSVQYASLPTNLLQSADATVAVWYTALDSASWTRVFDIGNSVGSQAGSTLYYTARSGDGQSRATLQPSGGSGLAATFDQTDDGAQHMAAVVVDASAGVLRLYVDGVQQSSTPLGGATAASVNDAVAYLGRSLWAADQGFTGLIDEVRVYDQALTTTQVAAQASAGTTQSPLAGDFNNDLRVDAQDFAMWREGGASPGGYEVWLNNYGAVAEPTGDTLSLDNQSLTLTNLTGMSVAMTGQSELHLTGASDPLDGTTVHLNSPDSWLFLHGVRPSDVNASHLSHVRVNGAMAMHGANVRVVQYEQGAVIIPHDPEFSPLEVFSGPQFTGDSVALDQSTYYDGAPLGDMQDDISSFVLKRGYMATFGTEANGTGFSKVYVAQDHDLHISLLETEFDDAVSFVRVLPWRWVAKKGASDASPQLLDAAWFYNWNNNQVSTLDYEYVPIRQQPYWPGLPYNNTDVTHHLGLNEPNNPVEHSYQNLNPQGSYLDAVNRWPEMMTTGLRIGSPAVTDGGKQWLYNFMDEALARDYRVDYIAIHNYQANHSPSSLYNWLKDVYDRYGLPIWLTEFNNGANWTGSTPSSNSANASVIGGFIDMFDNTPWIERYSIYGAVEQVRDVHWGDGSITPTGQVYRDNDSPIGYQQQAFSSGNDAQRSIGRYSFEGNTLDLSGYGMNGHASGAPSYVAGVNGQAIQLDGVDDVVRLPTDVASGASFTFATWVNWDGGSQWQRIFDFGNGTSQNLFLTPRSGGDTLRFAIKNGGSEQQLNTNALTPGQWTHVAVTIGGGTGRLYVNGAQVDSTAVGTVPSQINPTVNYLGDSQYASDPLFAGRLDDVFITDTALAPSQIVALMNGNQPAQFTTPVVTLPSISAGSAFSHSIAGAATDPDNPFASPTYQKANGPAWLTVLPNGMLSGTPPTPHVTDEFVITATDAVGATSFMVLNIPIGGSGGGGFVPMMDAPTPLALAPSSPAVEGALQSLYAEPAEEELMLAALASAGDTADAPSEAGAVRDASEASSAEDASTAGPFDTAFASF